MLFKSIVFDAAESPAEKAGRLCRDTENNIKINALDLEPGLFIYKVELNSGYSEKGKLIISYENTEELNNISQRLLA